MERLIEFASNNWLLVLAFFGVLSAILFTEIRRLTSGTKTIDAAVATRLYNREDAVFVDCRGEGDFRKGRLPGAVNIPASAVDKYVKVLDKHQGKPVVVYCNQGMQSSAVAEKIRKAGFAQVYTLRGGITQWKGDGFPIDND